MAELTRKAHEELSGSYSSDPFFGGVISALEQQYVPTKAEQVNGVHYDGLVNAFDGASKRFGSAFDGAIYKDSADTALQYSVRAFNLDVCGLLCTFAGAVARGPLTAAVANYVYATISAAGVVAIASATSGWPTTLHQKLAVITPPASGHWLPQHLVRWDKATAVRPSAGSVYCVEQAFAYNTSSPMAVWMAPAGSRILRATILIGTVFNGTAPTLILGDVGDTDRLMETTQNDPKIPDSYQTQPLHQYAAATQVNLTITPDASSAGAGVVLLEVRA